MGSARLSQRYCSLRSCAVTVLTKLVCVAVSVHAVTRLFSVKSREKNTPRAGCKTVQAASQLSAQLGESSVLVLAVLENIACMRAC